MNALAKVILMILLILYVISPIDLCIGPVDDIIVLIVGLCAMKARKARAISQAENNY